MMAKEKRYMAAGEKAGAPAFRNAVMLKAWMSPQVAAAQKRVTTMVNIPAYGVYSSRSASMKTGARMIRGPEMVRNIPPKITAGPVPVTDPIAAKMTAPAMAHPREMPALTHPPAGMRERAL